MEPTSGLDGGTVGAERPRLGEHLVAPDVPSAQVGTTSRAEDEDRAHRQDHGGFVRAAVVHYALRCVHGTLGTATTTTTTTTGAVNGPRRDRNRRSGPRVRRYRRPAPRDPEKIRR